MKVDIRISIASMELHALAELKRPKKKSPKPSKSKTQGISNSNTVIINNK